MGCREGQCREQPTRSSWKPSHMPCHIMDPAHSLSLSFIIITLFSLAWFFFKPLNPNLLKHHLPLLMSFLLSSFTLPLLYFYYLLSCIIFELKKNSKHTSFTQDNTFFFFVKVLKTIHENIQSVSSYLTFYLFYFSFWIYKLIRSFFEHKRIMSLTKQHVKTSILIIFQYKTILILTQLSYLLSWYANRYPFIHSRMT